jgi:hypothetical protein
MPAENACCKFNLKTLAKMQAENACLRCKLKMQAENACRKCKLNMQAENAS